MPHSGGRPDVAGFVFYLQSTGRKQATIKNYVTVCNRWINWCAGQKIDPHKATTIQCMAWLGEVSQKALPSTVRLYTLSLRVFYDYLKEAHVVRTNPARAITVRKQVTRPQPVLEHEDVRAMLGACETLQDRAMLLLMVGGGLRRSELLGITKEDIDFSRGTVRIYGKGGKWREIAPGVQAIEAVKMALGWRPRLFDYTHSDSIRRRIKYLAACGEVTKPVHPHMLRFYFAVNFCENGGGIDLLQTLLGHSSLEMSMFYSKAGRTQRALKANVQFNPADSLMA